MILLGNILGFISMVFLGLSVHKKDKQGMLVYQSLDCIFAILSCFCLGGYGGCVNTSVALIRNVVEHKGKTTKKFVVLLVIFTVVVGMYNILYIEKTSLALLPLIASVEYSLCMTLVKSYNKCRVALAVNLLLWTVYYFCILNIVSGLLSIVLFVNTLYSVYMANKEFSDNNMTKFQRHKLKHDFKKQILEK